MSDQARIEIQPGGPYAVHGRVPMTEMAPVHTFNGEPVAWHTLAGQSAPEEEPFELCRCGQSSSKPFCDGSHEANGFDGTETADRRPFAERAETLRARGATLVDDGTFCFSAGFCGTRTTDVWKLLLQSGDPEKYERMKDMVWHCPSGRLVLQGQDGNDLEPELPQEIAVLPGGPLWIRGGIAVTSSDGSEWETRNRVALYRCGDSKNKPFCDGTHSELHFDER